MVANSVIDRPANRSARTSAQPGATAVERRSQAVAGVEAAVTRSKRVLSADSATYVERARQRNGE